MDERLAATIAKFARRPDAQSCRDPEVARDQCEEMACRFALACRRAALPAAVMACENKRVVHFVTLVDGLTVDWTARQFAAQAPLPLVCTPITVLRMLPRVRWTKTTIVYGAKDPLPAWYRQSDQL